MYYDVNWFFHDHVAWEDPINGICFYKEHIYYSLVGFCSVDMGRIL